MAKRGNFTEQQWNYLQAHGKPTNRREFLAGSFASAAGFVMTPSILSVLASSTAKAANACDSGASGLPAFVNINLSGGACLAGNVVGFNANGDMLSKYDLVGLGNNNSFATETEFGNVVFPSTQLIPQSMLGGIRSTAPTAVAKTAFISMFVPSQSDTSTNAIDPTGMVTSAGLVGSLLPKLGTSRSTGTGVSNMAAGTAPPAPLIVGQISDLTSALAPASTLTSNLTKTQQQNLANLVSNLSGTQAAAVAAANSSSSQTLSTLVQCATGKNVELSTVTNPGIDPTLDTTYNVSGLWQMTNGGTVIGRSQNQRKVFGAMVYNALKGNCGSVGIELGGYDVHAINGVTAQNNADFVAGQLMGQVLATAELMQKPLYLVITTDGSADAPSGSGVRAGWQGDTGNSKGMVWVMAYHPSGRPVIKNDKKMSYQLGYLTNGLGSADDSVVGSTQSAANAVVANYLQFAGQYNALSGKAGLTFDQQTLSQVLRFA